MLSVLLRHKYLLLSLLSGVLLAASWPARGMTVLVFVALLPLFFVEHGLYRQRFTRGALHIFLYAWLAFGVFNLLTTWWIMYATFPGMVVAVVLNSAFMALPWWLMHLGRRVLPGQQGPLSLLLLWLAFEHLHTRWDLSWNWLDLGNVFSTKPALVQWFEYTGTAGGTAWVLLVNLMLFVFLRGLLLPGERTPRWYLPGLLSLLMLLLPMLISLRMYRQYEESPNPVEVVVIQPSVDPYNVARSSGEAQARIERMIELADSLTTPRTRFVVAPEGASPVGIWLHEAENHAMVRAVRRHAEAHGQLAWVFGSFVYVHYPEGEPASPTATPYPSGGYVDAYNAALMVEPGRPLATYYKSMLVPGIEQMPFYRTLGPVGRLVERFGGTAGSLGKQSERTVFHSGSGYTVAPAVCYESIYGDYMSAFYRRGAGLIFIITNDGWWRHTPGHRQHNQYARLRAIESRRSVARSASTGISSFINQRGDFISQTGWWEETAISASLNQNHHLTFFARNGNVAGRLSSLLSALFILYVLSHSLIKKNARS